jgi:hypothetical protein
LTSEQTLFLLQYGEIENLLVSSKKGGSAIIEFKDFKSAVSTTKQRSLIWKSEYSEFFISQSFPSGNGS